MPTLKPRPKVKAAASATGGAVVLAFLLRLLGVDVDQVPPEVLLAAAGGAASLAAYLKRDGLAGAWDRLVHGGEPEPALPAAVDELADLLRQTAENQKKILANHEASRATLASALGRISSKGPTP